jgi:hypothetical protein
VKTANWDFINAVLHVAEHGCKWRGLPKCFARNGSIAPIASGVSGVVALWSR